MGLSWVRASVFRLLHCSSSFGIGCVWPQPGHFWLSLTFKGYLCRCACASMESIEQVVSACFLQYAGIELPFVHHTTKVEHGRDLQKMLRMYIPSESDAVNFSCSCLARPLSLFYLIRKVVTLDWDLDLEEQSSKRLLVNGHNIELFAVLSARHGLVYAAMRAFWRDL